MSERRNLSKIGEHDAHEIQAEKKSPSAEIKISASFESFEGSLPSPERLNAYPESIRTTIVAEWEKNSSPEFVAFELRLAHQCISQILGKDDTMEEVLDEIFSRFCVGK